MANEIRLKRGSGSDPSASDLVTGEIAVRTDNGKLFTKKDDGSVAEISGGGIDDGDKGDITVSNSGATFTIDNDAVTFAKIQNITGERLLGRDNSGTGIVEALTASAVRTLLNVEDGATADQTASEILTLLKTVDGSGSGLVAERVTLTNQAGDSSCSVLFAQSATGDQLPHTNANLTFDATSGTLTSGGLDVTGNIIGTGKISIDGDGGSKYFAVGDNEDFKIYHDATGPTIFNDANNQGVKFQFKELNITEYTGTTTKAKLDSNGNFVVGGSSAQASDSATLMADGEVTAAGFYFSNNIGSAMNSEGIRRKTTNTIAFDTNSTERMTLDNSGLNVTGAIVASGDITANGGDIEISGTEAKLKLTDSNNNPDYILWNNGGTFRIYDNTNSTSRLTIGTGGTVSTSANLDVGNVLYVAGDANIAGGDLTITGGEGVSAVLKLVADQGDDNGDGWRLISNQDDNDLTFSNNTSGSYVDKLTLKNNGNLDVTGGIDVTGNITVTGTVDGVDIAARNTLFGGLTSSSGVLTNGVTGTTQGASDNTTKIATTAYVTTAISNLINGAPSALDTLNELAAAMNDDAAFSTTVTNSLATKMPLAGGEFTGNVTFSGSQTVDGRDLSVDGSKLDGIESGATADQTASEILTLLKTVDGNGSGLDADKLAGFSASNAAGNNTVVVRNSSGYIFANYFNTTANDVSSGVTKVMVETGNDNYIRHGSAAAVRSFINVEDGATADQSASEILTLIKTVDGAGSGLNADLLDGISSASFLRSDANDTASGQITLTSSTQYALKFNSSDDGKIVLAGSSNPYIRFQEGTTNKGYIQWHSSGFLQLANSEDGSLIRIKDDITFSPNAGSNNYKIWHENNDGSGSGLDADNLDGRTWSETAGNSTIVSRNGQGYVYANYFNTTANDVTSGVTKVFVETANDNFIRHGSAGAVRSFLNVENGATADQTASEILTLIKTVDGGGSGLNADLLDSINATSFLRSDNADTASADITFSGGAGAATIAANSDIRFTSGSWTGEATKIQHHGNWLYLQGGSSGFIFRNSAGTNRWVIDSNGAFRPNTDNAVNIGSTTHRVAEGHFLDLASRHLKADNGIVQTKQTIAFSYSLTADYNAMSVDPTVNNGVTVTVPSGAVWAIV